MRKTINKETFYGRIFDKSKLEIKKVQNEQSENYGKDFIKGTLDIATDDENLNIVSINFTYVAPVYKSGKENKTFGILENIIKNGKSVLTDGADNANLVRVDAALALNDFISNRDGNETLVSAKKNEGSFVSTVSTLGDESKRNTFECDVLIIGTQYVEADEEKNIDKDYLKINGYVFDFRGAILPVDFVVKSESGIKYFESLDASKSNPVFTKVWGSVNSETIVTRKEEESAFGEPAVKEYTRNIREWVITGTSKPELVYTLGDEENGITADELKKALADREVYLADVKRKAEEYQASKAGSATPAATSAPAAAGGFNF